MHHEDSEESELQNPIHYQESYEQGVQTISHAEENVRYKIYVLLL